MGWERKAFGKYSWICTYSRESFCDKKNLFVRWISWENNVIWMSLLFDKKRCTSQSVMSSSPRFSAPVAVKSTIFMRLSMMEVTNTPNRPISYTNKIGRNLIYESFYCFSIISHANKRSNYWLVDIRIYFGIFEVFLLDIGDTLKGFGIERSAKFNNDFTSEFWTNTTRLR